MQLPVAAARVCLLVTVRLLGQHGLGQDFREEIWNETWICGGHRLQGELGFVVERVIVELGSNPNPNLEIGC